MRCFNVLLLLFVFIGSSFSVSAQEETIFQIRNYRDDLSVQINHKQVDFALLGAYGKVENKTLANSGKYLFQGQEYDEFLAAYFFPSRMYDTKALRFLQVDPKSQYHSPYLFVGADPVNVIDRDGKEGRPLFIFGENHDVAGGFEPFKKDIQAAFPDAHVVPLSDVVNGDVVPLPEWNGNVYLCTHTGLHEGMQVEVERGKNLSDFKTEGLEEGLLDDKVTSAADVSGEYLGERLGELSLERGVPIKNVFVGGCQGSKAAERISDGFVNKMKGKFHGIKARFIGTKKGVFSHYETSSFYKKRNLKSLEGDVRLHLGAPSEQIHTKIYEDAASGNHQSTIDQLNERGRVTGVLPSADKEEFGGLVEGRVPKNLERSVNVIERIY